MLTAAKVEAELRRALTGGLVTIRAGKLTNCAALVHLRPHPPHSITVDTHQGGALEGVIHELVHVVYRGELERWGRLEESIVIVLEDAVVRHVNRSKRRAEWWRRRIDGALAK